jgi:hypothetical protein
MSAPTEKKEPTPDLTDVVSVLERERPLTQWDIKPPGYENVSAEQAKLSGKFPLPGARAGHLDNRLLKKSGTDQESRAALDPEFNETGNPDKKDKARLNQPTQDSSNNTYGQSQPNGTRPSAIPPRVLDQSHSPTSSPPGLGAQAQQIPVQYANPQSILFPCSRISRVLVHLLNVPGVLGHSKRALKLAKHPNIA